MTQEPATNMVAHEAIGRIVHKEFGGPPSRVQRMSNGICNEVYAVGICEQDVVVRLNADKRYLYGSHDHIPIFRARGITVPEILAEDYSKDSFPFAYQVLSKIDGRDINDVIGSLSDAQLRAIAGEIANVFRRLRDVPNNGRFGVQWGDDRDLVDSWAADIRRMCDKVVVWGKRTGVWEPQLEQILDRINVEYGSYFETVEPVTYYGDICAKNVMVYEGRFSGLVDLDALAQGDWLEAVGRIRASWYGTHWGRVYSDSVMDELELTLEQRSIVNMYTLLNRTYWTFENGVQFNQNTRPVVDRKKEKRDKATVEAIYREFVNQ